jgi:lipopolysaccharide export LptBFGC system permease protein LptF
MARLVDPILADLQAEHHEAATLGSAWGRYLAWLRAIVALVRVATIHSAGRVAWQLVGRPYEERRAVSRAVVVTAASLVVFVAVLCAPFMANDGVWRHESRQLLLAYMVPSCMSVALPASLVCGMVFGLGQAQRRLRAAVVALALVASCASWYLVAFAVPASNQLYRKTLVSMSGTSGPPRGISELTLGEIDTLRAEATLMPGTLPIGIRALTRAYHTRWSLAASPLVLAFAILSMTRGRRWVDAGIAAGVVLGQLTGFVWSSLTYRSPVAAAWAPNAVVMIVAVGVIALRWQRERVNARTGDLLLD